MTPQECKPKAQHDWLAELMQSWWHGAAVTDEVCRRPTVPSPDRAFGATGLLKICFGAATDYGILRTERTQ